MGKVSRSVGRWRAAVLMGVTATLCVPASAKSAPTEPQGRWAIDKTSGQCTLLRTMSAPNQGLFSLQTYPGTDAYRLLLATGAVPLHSAAATVSVTFLFHDADAQFSEKAAGTKLSGDLGNALWVAGLDPTVVTALAHASSVSLVAKSGPVGPYALPNADKAAQALERCVADQLVAWGADPAQFDPGGAMPVALKERDSWVPNDQLLGMLADARDIDAHLRVSITVDGRVDGCARLDAGNGAKVEKIACAAVTGQSLFQPARDPSGRPVRGAAVFAVRLISRR